MHMGLPLSVVGFCLLLAPGVHAAAPVAEPQPPESSVWVPSPEYDDYRLTLFAVDATSVSLLVASGFVQYVNLDLTTTLVLAGFGGYLFGGPIVHLAYEQPLLALGSFGLRVGLPVAGVWMANLVAPCETGEAEFICGGAFGFAGALAAMLIDDIVLGKAPRPSEEYELYEESSFSLGFLPQFEPKKKFAGLSLLGTF
jgi:hypothetical protein